MMSLPVIRRTLLPLGAGRLGSCDLKVITIGITAGVTDSVPATITSFFHFTHHLDEVVARHSQDVTAVGGGPPQLKLNQQITEQLGDHGLARPEKGGMRMRVKGMIVRRRITIITIIIIIITTTITTITITTTIIIIIIIIPNPPRIAGKLEVECGAPRPGFLGQKG
jgi:hypothetical protein